MDNARSRMPARLLGGRELIDSSKTDVPLHSVLLLSNHQVEDDSSLNECTTPPPPLHLNNEHQIQLDCFAACGRSPLWHHLDRTAIQSFIEQKQTGLPRQPASSTNQERLAGVKIICRLDCFPMCLLMACSCLG
jgi:hypothetical protein